MSMFKHILVATDGSALSDEAVTTAAHLAHALGAKLTAVNVRVPYLPAYPYWTGYGPMIAETDFEDAMREDSASKLDAAVRIAAEEQSPCRTVSVASESPWRAILGCAHDEHCDAIVMASHGRKGLDALLLGSETRKVLEHAAIPVIVTRPKPA